MNKLAVALFAALACVSATGCKNKSGGGAGGDDALAKMSELKAKMCACKDPDCAKRVSDEMTAWSQERAKKQKTATLSEADQKKASELGTQMGECMAKAMAVAPPTPPPSPAEGSGSAAAAPAGSAAETPSGLPKECDDYKLAIERLSTCEAMSKQARETLVKAFADAAEGWKKQPEAAKERLKATCKAGADAVTQVAKAQCGW